MKAAEKAWKRLALLHHPDWKRNNPNEEVEMKHINGPRDDLKGIFQIIKDRLVKTCYP